MHTEANSNMIKTNREVSPRISEPGTRYDLNKLKKEKAVVCDVKGVITRKSDSRL